MSDPVRLDACIREVADLLGTPVSQPPDAAETLEDPEGYPTMGGGS
jgi:hypothetical protein